MKKQLTEKQLVKARKKHEKAKLLSIKGKKRGKIK